MNTLRQAAQQALEALAEMTPSGVTGSAIWNQQMNAITALSKALEQPEQELVGEVLNERGEIDYISYVPPVGTRLYTTLPAAQRKPLTDEQIEEIWVEHGCEGEDACGFARAIEAAHGIKEGT